MSTAKRILQKLPANESEYKEVISEALPSDVQKFVKQVNDAFDELSDAQIEVKVGAKSWANKAKALASKNKDNKELQEGLMKFSSALMAMADEMEDAEREDKKGTFLFTFRNLNALKSERFKLMQ